MLLLTGGTDQRHRHPHKSLRYSYGNVRSSFKGKACSSVFIEIKQNHPLGIHRIFTMAIAWGTTTTHCWGFTMALHQKRLGCSQSLDRTNFNSLAGSLFITSAVRKLQQTIQTNHSNQTNCFNDFAETKHKWGRALMFQSYGTMCFSQSLCWLGPAEPPVSTRTGRCKSSWKRSSPTLTATCWSWPRSWSQGCKEKRQQRNASTDRFIPVCKRKWP